MGSVVQNYSNNSSAPIIPLSPLQQEKYKLLWNQFGWDRVISFERVATKHSDFFNFIYDSKLIFSIRGYQNSFKSAQTENDEVKPFLDGIKFDYKDHPLLFKEGQWVRWEDIKKEIVYDKELKLLVSSNDPTQEWSYIYPRGLVPQTRKGYIEPIYQLNPLEHARLQEFAGTTEDKKHIVQIYTTEKSNHAGIRLITELGEVYSFTLLLPENEYIFEEQSKRKFLATYNVHIVSPDFSEFVKLNRRRVTSIPVSLENFQNALDRVKNYAKQPLRFNFMHQNCITLAADVLNAADIPIEVHCWVGEYVWDIAKNIPVLGAIVRFVDQIVKAVLRFFDYITPQFIQVPFKFAVRVITYIPLKILTVIRNVCILCLGGGKVGAPIPEGVAHNWDNREGLTAFHAHINSWSDLFKDDMGKISSTDEVKKWQLTQHKKRTFTHTSNGSPAFHIAPPASSEIPT